MAEDVEAQLAHGSWIPKLRRELVIRAFHEGTAETRALLSFTLATRSLAALDFWRELIALIHPKDPRRQVTAALAQHGVTISAARTASPREVSDAFLELANAQPSEVPAVRARILALGSGASLANAHGIYVSATRKAKPEALPREPPHLGGPTPELTVFETVEVALTMARLALSKKPNAEGDALVALAGQQLAWARRAQKTAAPTSTPMVPQTSRTKGPGFALARAALMEACNLDHVSARGTSIKSAVQWGLELGEAWWLGELDEAIMRSDARAAWERRRQSTSSPVEHLVWRGGDDTTRLWLVRLQSKSYALLAKLGRNWSSLEGDLQSVAATVPDAWFARAMPVIEKRR